jgi:hypothetical protein
MIRIVVVVIIAGGTRVVAITISIAIGGVILVTGSTRLLAMAIERMERKV